MIFKKKIILISITFLLFTTNTNFAQRILINEFMASNASTIQSHIPSENYSDWIELYNDEDTDINLKGFYLTDNLSNSTKWKFRADVIIKAKDFLLLWANGTTSAKDNPIISLSFKLLKDREEIGIYNSDKVILDSIIYSSQITDVSFGRNPNDINQWLYFGEPTPGNWNSTVGINNTKISDDVEFSIESGVYSGSQTLQLSTNSSNAIVRFTLDGSMPSSNSSTYQSPIQILKTEVVRARSFENNKLPGKIISKSFFINTNNTLPIVSIITEPDLFFANTTGIYKNEILSKDVPVNFELIEKNNSVAINTISGAKLTGQASFVYPQKSLTISAKKKYGAESFNYSVFPDREISEYKDLYLRNSGTQDNRHTMFRDALQHSLVINKMDLDVQAYRPVATYINGKYWGIYNLREKLNEDHLVAHHNVDPKSIDYLEYEFNREPVIISGSAESYNSLIEYLKANDINDIDVYKYVKTQLDINEIMNYLITEIYCDNVNWPATNSRWWRNNSNNSKWRYVLLDLDYGFGATSSLSKVENNTFEYLYEQRDFSTVVFRKLLENEKFKDEFVQRFAIYLNTVFHFERVVNIVDSIQTLISEEMVRHIDRWNDDPTIILYDPPIPDIETWNDEVEIMRDFANRRSEFIITHINDFFQLNNTEKINVSIPNSNEGKVYINNYKIGSQFSAELFKDIPIKIKAVPAIGYKFVRWLGVENGLNTELEITLSDNGAINLQPIFELTEDNLLPTIFSSNTTLSISGSPYFAKGDIYIEELVTLTVEEGVEIIMPPNSSIIVNGNINFNGTKNLPIQIKNNEKYGYDNWGVLFFDNATADSHIKFVNISGATNGSDKKNQKGTISVLKSKVIIDNVTIENVPFPIFAQNSEITIRNSKLHSNQTSDLINIKNSDIALVENCELRGNNSLDVDAIDFDNISNGVIRGNRIYNFFGENSDGIDLGEGSKDVLIKDNLIYNCYDKGISIGQASTAVIENNIIVNCTQGIAVKDDLSFAKINQNTIYACDYGVACFEKNIGKGGGSANVVNTIFSKSKISPTFVDAFSSLNITYSMFDEKKVVGFGNQKNDPQFSANFSLSQNSPAINSGDPNSENDPDGSLADMGALYFSNSLPPQIIVSEVLYKSHNDKQFIELYNADIKNIDLTNFSISGSISFTFPAGTTIQKNEYLIVARNKDVFSDQGYKVFQWQNDNLNNSGDIKIVSNKGTTIDLVTFKDSLFTVKTNSSLELINTNLENLYLYNWQESFNEGGSPGTKNLLSPKPNLFINEFQASNTKTITDEFGEYDDWIEIYNSGNNSININGLYLTDDYNNLTKYKLSSTISGKNFIAPKGFYLLWADENSKQGNHHLNFKLSSKGEQIALVHVIENDTTIIDSIKYGKLSDDISYARIDDGENEWTSSLSPSPGISNNPLTDIKQTEVFTEFKLFQNYPNPFNPTTKIKFTIPNVSSNISNVASKFSSRITLKIYNVLGKEVATLVNKQQEQGSYEVTFNASSLASGVYYYQIRTENFVQTKKMLLLK
ncbi:MAG: lamin tail domain-containing protein [Melioribacteraceae bacterium]